MCLYVEAETDRADASILANRALQRLDLFGGLKLESVGVARVPELIRRKLLTLDRHDAHLRASRPASYASKARVNGRLPTPPTRKTAHGATRVRQPTGRFRARRPPDPVASATVSATLQKGN